MRPRHSRAERRERGATSTEVAVLMPVLMALVLVPFQVGLWWHAQQVAEGAARHALVAAQVVDGTESDAVAAASWFLDQAGNLEDPHVSVERTDDTVTVEITGNAPRLLFTWSVAAHVAGPTEQFLRGEPNG